MCGLKQSSEPLSQNNKRLCSNKLKNGFENTQVFADDGYSGVNFERPAFRRMLHLIEDGKIGLDLTVDIARPRRIGSVRLTELEAEVLNRVMQRGDNEVQLRKQG